jgi:uracil-DNA glycosylase
MSSRSTKPLIIGEMPGAGKLYQDEKDLGPIAGATGRRLAKLLGISLDEYILRWDRRNIFANRVPGPWDTYHAGLGASLIYAQESGFVYRPLVVLLGKKVHAAFGFRSHAAYQMIPAKTGKMQWLLMPHPSGLCRWWNDPSNTHSVEVLLRGAYDSIQEKRYASAKHA